MPLKSDLVTSITDELVRAGQIPEEYRRTFEEGLEAEIYRAVVRYRTQLVNTVAQAVTSHRIAA